ncbi:stage II sporulation protein M [Paenibacillus phyllosphaerae]|uniref:Stage II sporulation protein M n=1 Tax=Paenibacillus phyllosphaerae TaxID=274593 RepID=A0A7W5FRI2_9BACL|nr:stage II sporulation protein M [Paenibacillus phyllosphaerae]MBB3114327.1 stage II sporulation protein M [Paenibacillus phyllosphaerae]
MFSWRNLINHFIEMRHYLIASTIIFVAGLVVGATNADFNAFITGQVDSLREVANTIQSSDNPTLGFIVFIFLNNVIKSILVMYIGAAFGLIPIFFLAVNGMVLGYVVNQAAGQGGDMLYTIIVKGLLPHGILEIPAILIACAYGIKFGALMFQGIGNLFVKRDGWGASVERFVVRTVPVSVLLVVTLLVAAVIESTITAWLLS